MIQHDPLACDAVNPLSSLASEISFSDPPPPPAGRLLSPVIIAAHTAPVVGIGTSHSVAPHAPSARRLMRQWASAMRISLDCSGECVVRKDAGHWFQLHIYRLLRKVPRVRFQRSERLHGLAISCMRAHATSFVNNATTKAKMGYRRALAAQGRMRLAERQTTLARQYLVGSNESSACVQRRDAILETAGPAASRTASAPCLKHRRTPFGRFLARCELSLAPTKIACRGCLS